MPPDAATGFTNTTCITIMVLCCPVVVVFMHDDWRRLRGLCGVWILSGGVGAACLPRAIQQIIPSQTTMLSCFTILT